MDVTVNDLFNVIPQMQKILLCSTEKIEIMEQIIPDYEEKIDFLNQKNEEFDNKLKDMDIKIQDFNIADLLKSNIGGGSGEGEEGNNNLMLNLISNLEKKFNAKSQTTDGRLNKLEETNFKLLKRNSKFEECKRWKSKIY